MSLILKTKQGLQMKIEIDRYSAEALDELSNAILIEDWQNVKSECKRLKRQIRSYDPNDKYRKILKEDLKTSKKTRKAYETIMRYCLSPERISELLGE